MKVVTTKPVEDPDNPGVQNTEVIFDIKGYRPSYVEAKLQQLRPNYLSVEFNSAKKWLVALLPGIENALFLRDQLVEELRQPIPPAL